MIKKCLLFISVILLTGCTYVNNVSYEELITSVVTSSYNLTNQYHKGYKYYLPNGLYPENISDFNELLSDGNNKYYLYVDVVSYYNRVINEYEKNDNAFYSDKINFEDKFGYIEINKQQNEKYFIEIMYNYAKIEVIVDKCDINKAITNSIIMLSSVSYNNEILKNVIDENIFEFNEEEFNIFKVKRETSNYLEVESQNIYEDVEEDIDPDLVD